jgi:signal transduction histidine kinase
MRGHGRVLTLRYVGALLTVAALLVAGQLLIQRALDLQEADSHVVNTAGRQRMLSQRLCVLLLALDRAGDTTQSGGATQGGDATQRSELARVADEWQSSQESLARGRPETGIKGGNSPEIAALYAQIDGDHRAMLAAARAAIAGGPGGSGAARIALDHQEAFLAGMDRIVDEYEREARTRVVRLRWIEISLLGLALAVLLLEGAFVFRPAVRHLGEYLAQRDLALQQVVTVSDREQQRLAQDLHDGLGQHLVGVAFLVKSLGRDAPEAQREKIAEIGRLIGEAVEQSRSLARDLYSQTLGAEGLAAALRELAAHTERVYGVSCRLALAADHGALREAVRGHLHRIAREAVLNAAKHARAKSIEIELAQGASHLTLSVRDDGVGIGARTGGGMGLHLMEYRAKMIGASLRVMAGEPRGTTVTCTIPLAEPPSREATA